MELRSTMPGFYAWRFVALELLIPGGLKTAGPNCIHWRRHHYRLLFRPQSNTKGLGLYHPKHTSNTVKDTRSQQCSRLARMSNISITFPKKKKEKRKKKEKKGKKKQGINIVTTIDVYPTVMPASQSKHIVLRANDKCQTAHECGCLVDDHLL